MNNMREFYFTNEETAQVCARLAMLLSAGAAYDTALEAMAADEHNAKLSEALLRWARELDNGKNLEEACRAAGGFPNYMVQMLGVGLAAGALDVVLPQLAGHYTREAGISETVRRAAVYPAMLAAMISAVFLVLINKVLPVFGGVFGQLGMSLSPAALLLLRLGEWSRSVAGLFAILLILGVVFGLYLLYTQAGRSLGRRMAEALLRRSRAGRELARGRFAGTLSILLSSGMGLDQCMERTEKLLENTALSENMRACRDAMDNGADFPAAVERSGLLGGIDCCLLTTAFRTGSTEESLGELAGRCAERAETAMDRLLGRSELILVAVLCAAVGLVLLSVMLPLLGAMSAMGG